MNETKMSPINLNKIKKFTLILVLFLTCIIVADIVRMVFILKRNQSQPSQETKYRPEIIQLPQPIFESKISVERALLERRSVRDYKDEPLTLFEISQLLWSAQGITDQSEGGRTAPSAGATYPLEVYLVVGNIKNLAKGIYKYKPQKHQLLPVREGDKREEIYRASLEQSSVKEAPLVLIFSAVYERTTTRYGERGIRYVHFEVGHAAQNVYLQAVSLNLGTVVIGAFDDSEVKKIINMPEEEKPLYIIPVGRKSPNA